MGKKTVRLSLKTIAMRFPDGSVERVYFHGRWQEERGRGPTMLFGNHDDPKMALDSAKRMIGSYLESIRKMPYSRHWPWGKELVQAIQQRKFVDDLERVVWLG